MARGWEEGGERESVVVPGMVADGEVMRWCLVVVEVEDGDVLGSRVVVWSSTMNTRCSLCCALGYDLSLK